MINRHSTCEQQRDIIDQFKKLAEVTSWGSM